MIVSTAMRRGTLLGDLYMYTYVSICILFIQQIICEFMERWRDGEMEEKMEKFFAGFAK